MENEVSKETKAYFKRKSRRFSAYEASKEKAVEFIREHDVHEGDLCVFLMVGSLLWTSAQLDERLTETELFQLLGIEDELDDDDTEMYEAYEGLLEYDLEDFLFRIYQDNK